LHSLGSFDAYNITLFFFGYDKLVHFTSAITGAAILSKILYTNIMPNVHLKISHKDFLTLFSVLSVAMLAGVMTEFIEFLGYTYLDVPWPGIFSPMDLKSVVLDNYYTDTIHDLFIDLIGALIGGLGYFLIIKK
jgi:hypothetical protein